MYTHSGARGAKHEWVPSVNLIGILSYVNVHVFRVSHGFTYSSLSSPALQSATFMHVPPTHVLFSFGAFSTAISHHSMTTDAAHPFALTTLCPESTNIMQNLCTDPQVVSDCVKALKQARKGQRHTQGETLAIPDDEGAHWQTDADEDGTQAGKV